MTQEDCSLRGNTSGQHAADTYKEPAPSVYKPAAKLTTTKQKVQMAEMAAGKVAFLVVFVSLFLIQEGQCERFIEEWKKGDFPNPTRDLNACGRRGKVSWICDPDKILSYETTNKIEELLYSVRKNTDSGCSSGEDPGFQVGVAVLNRMHKTPDESVAETAENFAKHLHDSWGVGHFGCDDGALLFLSIVDRQVYVSTGKRAMEVLSDDQVDIIIDEMKPYLKNKEYDQSVELAVVRMGEVFSGRVLSSPINYGLIIFCMFFLVCVGVGLYIGHKQDQERQKCTRKLKRIQEERDRANHSQKSYESKSCPICLEEFQPETKTKLLACGHKYCEPCLTKWLEDHATCPICRQSADSRGDEGGACHSSNTSDFMPELLFRLTMLQLQHPSFITSSMVNRWSSSSYTGSFVSDPIFVRSSMPGGGSFGSGTSFGGGSSSGGGGRGGSW